MLLLLLACQAVPEDPSPTYYRDVRPVLDQTCARCHTDDGLASSFDDPATVQALAPSIKAQTQSGVMPPPAPDPDCADYEGSEVLFLGDEAKALLAAWADLGAPLGDPADAPAAFTPPTSGPFDVEIFGEGAYAPQFVDPEGAGNDYRCFLLELGNEERSFITGFEALVDNPRIVHHVVLWALDDAVAVPVSDDGQAGYACGGFGEDGYDFVAGWAPGGGPTIFPEGMGLAIGTNARFALQMHYFDSFDGAEFEVDHSGFGLHLADSVDTRIFQMPLGVEDFLIPAGAAAHEEQMFVPWSASWGAVTVLGTFPHMHLLATGFDFRVTHADATESCVAEMDGWDFHNQASIALKEPVTIEGGDVVTVTCRWDNSAANPNQLFDPPRDVEFGEETNDEMCYAFTYGYQP